MKTWNFPVKTYGSKSEKKQGFEMAWNYLEVACDVKYVTYFVFLVILIALLSLILMIFFFQMMMPMLLPKPPEILLSAVVLFGQN